MAGIDRAKIGTKLYKQLDKKGLLKEIIIKRHNKGAYGEESEDLYVCTIKGYYHREESSVETQLVESARINKLYQDRFLLICDDNSNKIKEDDFFILNNITFNIIDLGSIEDIIFDMYLRRL